jgi:acetamidase/formamidase
MRIAKLNPGFVAAGSTLAASKALHDGKTILLDTLTGSVVTLPAATGSGCKIRVFEKIAATSNSHKVQVQNSTDVMAGNMGVTLSTGVGVNFPTVAASDTVTLNRTTSGGATNGGHMDFEDIAAGIWSVRGQLNGSGVLVTPFSAAV